MRQVERRCFFFERGPRSGCGRESARKEVSGARRDEDRRGRAYLAGLSGGASCFASGSGSYATRMSPFAHSAAISSVSAALSWVLGVRSTLVVGVDFVSRVQDLGGGGRPDAGGGGTRPTRRSVAPESVDDGSRRYTHLSAASTSVHSASGVGDAMSPSVARRDVRRGERVGGFSSPSFFFSCTLRRRQTLAIGIQRSGRFALRRLPRRDVFRYLATFTPSLPPRASGPVSPPAPPSTPGQRA